MATVTKRRATALVVAVVAFASMGSAAFAAAVPDALEQRTPKAISGPDTSYIELAQQQIEVQAELETQLDDAKADLKKQKAKYAKAVAALKARAAAAAAAAARSSSSSSSSSSRSHDDEDDDDDHDEHDEHEEDDD
jgi:hypothetical protein